MQTGGEEINMGVKCNLLPLRFLNRSSSKFVWLKSSVHQDTLVAKHEDGSFSILAVKHKGNVSSFVLDPNLRCVFWDNENASEHRQLLYAQARNEDVLLYAVDEDGVTELSHVSRTRLMGVIKTSHDANVDFNDKTLQLVGCGRGQIILHIASLGLCCIDVPTAGLVRLNCTVPLPQSAPASDAISDSTAGVSAGEPFSCYQVLSGTIVVFDRVASELYTYSLSSGQCLTQLDLHPLNFELNLLLDWRVSHDLSALMLLLKDFVMVHVNIKEYSSQYPSCHRLMDSRIYEQAFNQKYLSFNLCRYGDVAWKQEVVRQHMSLTGSNKMADSSVNPLGFRVHKKKAQKDSAPLLGSVSAPCKSTLRLETIEQKRNWRLRAMEASNTVLTLVLSRQSTPGDNSRQALCFVNFVDHSVHIHTLSESTSVVLSSSPTCSHMLLSDGHLMFISPDAGLHKDDLISWMMSYSGPGCADCLCQTNQWTRTAVPLHALESSLKQRQLDTLAFYCKSKRNMFNEAVQQSGQSSVHASEVKQSGQSSVHASEVKQSGQSSVHASKVQQSGQSSVHASEVQQSGQSSIHASEVQQSGQSSVHASEVQQSGQSSVHASEVQQSGQSSVHASEVQQLDDALRLVAASVTSSVADPQGRMFAERLLSLTLDFVYALLEDSRQIKEQTGLSGSQVAEWCQVVLSHIPALRQCMCTLQYRAPAHRTGVQAPGGQGVLETGTGSSVKPSLESSIRENSLSSYQALAMSAAKNEAGHYRELVAEVLWAVRQHIERKDISACQQLLKNIGCDAPLMVWSLAQFYASRSIQQFVTGQLSAALSPSQRQTVQYLEQVYKVYPCASFSAAMKSKVVDKSGTWPDKEDPLQEAVFASDTFLLSHCKELIQENSSESSDHQGDLYVSLLLAWLADWSEDMKHAVLLDAHFLSTGEASLVALSQPRRVWHYLISHNMVDDLLSLLKSASSDARLTVPGELTDFLHLGWSYLRSELARQLLKLGKLNLKSAISQGVDISALLPSVGDIMKKPHPLSYVGAAQLNRLHDEFIISCISAGLQLPLWMYCSIHGISPSEVKGIPECSWLPLFQEAYSIPRQPTDRSLILRAGLLAAADLWATSSGEMTVEMMLERNHILAAVGTLSYMSEADLNLSESTIERCLHTFPKLVLALLPDGHESSPKQNTTVYQLLMGTGPLELRRLFGWHSSNTFAREDSPRVMPNFSDSQLKVSYCRHQRLLFPYYLKHGRPVFAFLSFLSEELDRGDATLSLKRLQQACGAALWIACGSFQTAHITSSCVVFVELLGRDSTLVRTMVHVGRLLFAHRHRNISGGAEARKEQLKKIVAEIVSELQACVRSRNRHGNKLIKSLEDAIVEEIRLEGVASCSFEAGSKWMLAVILCKLLGLQLSSCFLQACAEGDNWFMFVWFAQLHQYPTHQLQMLLHSFTSANIRDHLYYVLNNADCKLFSSSSSSSVSSTVNGTGNDKSNQSQRTSLYNRIGLQRSQVDSSSEEEEDKTGQIVISSFSSRLKQTEFNESEMPESTAPEDVFRMLFHSSSMPCQWKCLLAASVSLGNPLFAELAACCGCPAVPSLCGWLLASLSPQVKQNLLSINGQQVSKWTLEHLEAVIHATLDCGHEKTLTTAFNILQPQSALLPFLSFVAECVKGGNYASCKTYIDQFKEAMASSDIQKPAMKIASDLPTIGDRAWFEKLSYEILRHELMGVDNLYDARHLLEILDKHNICLVFSFDVLDFGQLHKIIKVLHGNSVPNLHLPSLLTSGTGSKPFLAQCEAAVDYLVTCAKFSEARELTLLAGISPEKVIINQLREDKQRLVRCGAWTAKFARAQYWSKSVELMQQANCSLEACGQFFQEELQGTSAEFEKAVLCQHWFTLLEGNNSPDVAAAREAVFRDMWRYRIAAKVALEETEPLDQVFDEVDLSTVLQGDHKSDIIHVTAMSHRGSDTHDLGAQELEVLDSLMGSYLDKGRVSACTEVASVFGHYNQDLAIIQTCIALATRQSSIENIEPAMKRLVAKSSSKRVRGSSVTLSRSFSISSINSTTSGLADLMTQTQELSAVMEKLYAHCEKGSQVCLRVVTCFKIAQMLELAYEDIVMNSPFDSLRLLLRVHDPYKFALARDFLATSGLSDDEVAGFLADSIVEVLKVFVKGNHSDLDADLNDGGHSEMMFNPSDGMEVFSQFLKLCENIALLGDCILQAVASLLSSGQQNMSASVLTIQTELIIMAHECYTVSSNMEGISHVLRAARVCCDRIAEAREFALMIRLLTGVGRYSEMLYIFHALQQQHQFELLLCKGMDREDKLKVAILDYLKRYQPDDSEAYTMVALKFTMYRDIAGMLEACGYRTLKLLKDKTLDNSKDVQELLRKCLQYFRDAAESYVKAAFLHFQTYSCLPTWYKPKEWVDNSVRKAQSCVRQARLLSLQLQLVANGVCVINLSRDQVATFVNTHGRFIEAMVVSDAYDRRADWTEAVLNNVVINGDTRYLQEMRLHVHVTSALVEDVVKRYKQVNTKTSAALTAIRKLLTLTKDAQLQYRLASELGLADMVTSMLKGDTGSYLQDITAVL